MNKKFGMLMVVVFVASSCGGSASIAEPAADSEEADVGQSVPNSDSESASDTTPVTKPLDPDAPVEVKLFRAISDGDLDLVTTYLDEGADIELGVGTSTPLHHASESDEVEIVKLLLERGADIDAETSGQRKAISFAASGNAPEVIVALEQAGADLLQIGGEWGSTPIHDAAKTNAVEAIETLLELGVDVDQLDSSKSTPLMWSVNNNNEEATQFLIEAGADVNIKDAGGATAMSMAESEEVRTILEEAGAAK